MISDNVADCSYPEMVYHEPFIHDGKKVKGGFAIRFEHGQFVNLTEKIISIFIPFIGTEKKCRDCGGNRELILRCNLEGEVIDYDECCDKPARLHH